MDAEKPTDPSTIAFKGSCACQRITYDSTRLPQKCTACHCTTCRKLSSALFQAFAEVPNSPKSVTFYDNREHLRYDGLPKDDFGGITFLRLFKVADRAFCASCHTPLAMRYAHDGGAFDLTVGSVDETSLKDAEAREAFSLKQHIFVSQKAWWHDPKIEQDDISLRERFTGTFEEDAKVYEGKEG